MIATLPPEMPVRVVARPASVSEETLARSDAAVVLLEKTDAGRKRLATLPHAALWTALLGSARRAGNEWPTLVTRLPNRRHTLAVVAFTRPAASGFERLELAGKLAKEVVQPGVATLQLHALVGGPAQREALLEAVLSAVLAHAAPMPEAKNTASVPAPLASVEIAGPRSPAYERSVAVAQGNHLARWLATLPPNVLDTPGYRKALARLAKREG
ncbi:MAG: hypothetical protein ACR2I8_10290, partial [Steroidobacteraceae bacterium]